MNELSFLNLINREHHLFEEDLKILSEEILEIVANSKFLIIGGAGSIGQAVTKEIFKRNPRCLHVVDISENNMVELVREIRSSAGYIKGDFQTYSIDCGSLEFGALVQNEGPYDYVFNLSALKHVRSEKDPYTLMRLIAVNIVNTIHTVDLAKKMSAKNYFCVSTDKAANPVNMMGGSKKIMEMFLMRESLSQNISMARFANVMFSDGSLLHGFNQRFNKRQPLAAPNDIKRYFITPQESGELCLLAGLFAENRDIFFPKLNAQLNLITFSDIAERYLNHRGFTPYICNSEEEARIESESLISKKLWPCYFSSSDTTGEKDFEEFYTEKEDLDLDLYKSIGVIKNEPVFISDQLDDFSDGLNTLRKRNNWSKRDILSLYEILLPEFQHIDRGKYLDQKM